VQAHQQCDGSHGQSHATDEGTLICQHGNLHGQGLADDRIAPSSCLGGSPAAQHSRRHALRDGSKPYVSLET
jgi:hypothetical protein